MPKYRMDRLNEELLQELSNILRTIKDPRVSGNFVGLTEVVATPDLKQAKVYYSTLGNDPKNDAEVLTGLKNSAGYMRTQLAKTINLRLTPELKFIRDESAQTGARIEKILKEIIPQEDDESEE